MNRRGFFTAVLAPMLVPWNKYPQEYITVMGPFEPFWPRSGYLPSDEIQRRMNELYNQRIDNITLSL